MLAMIYTPNLDNSLEGSNKTIIKIHTYRLFLSHGASLRNLRVIKFPNKIKSFLCIRLDT